MDETEKRAELEAALLSAARNNDLDSLRALLDSASRQETALDVNCQGKTKANRGWTPLHLAAYFGHTEASRLLLENGANIDALNDVSDSPLHRAAFTGRQEIVLMLLKHGASVHLINAEGRRAQQVARTKEIRELIEATECTEKKKVEEEFLKAARDGDVATLTRLLRLADPPSVNCVDAFGNTALHLAAQRSKREVVVLLLQNGVNTTLHNARDETAIELATDAQMRLLLDVKSVRPQRLRRHEGPLFRKLRLLGWRPVWTVLDRGVLSLFPKRMDASSERNMKLMKCLDNARVQLKADSTHIFTLTFSDHTSMTLCVNRDDRALISRQKWESAFQEHAACRSRCASGAALVDVDDDRDEMLPLSSLQDTFKVAQGHHQTLEREVVGATKDIDRLSTSGQATSSTQGILDVLEMRQRFSRILASSRDTVGTLALCLRLFEQQDELRRIQLEDEIEKSRVLQDSLHVLAKEHLLLERSMVTGAPFHPPGPPGGGGSFHPQAAGSPGSEGGSFRGRAPSVVGTSEEIDEFFDCGDDGEESGEENSDDVGACGVQDDSADDDFKMMSSTPCVSADQSLVGKQDLGMSIYGGRCRLPVSMFSRRNFSVWSFLKQCIGRELSKITMPVIFNEPLSFLQRMVEYLEYTALIRRADNCDDSVQRLELVSAFAVSSLASNWERIGKPFNPLLGETYQLDREDLGFRGVCEQVSHHPPVSAFHAHSPNFTFHGTIQPKIKFWGKSVEVTPKGVVTLYLNGHKEAYTWQYPNCCVHNIIVGKIWIEHNGGMEIVNQTTRQRALLTFKTSGWFSADLHKVEGFIVDDKNKKLRALYGSWTEALYSCEVDVWQSGSSQANPRQSDALQTIPSDANPATGHQAAASNHTGPQSADTHDQLAPSVGGMGGSALELPGPLRSSAPPDVIRDSTAVDSIPQQPLPQYYPRPLDCDLRLAGQRLLWVAAPKPPHSSDYYNFTLFAMLLNELSADASIGAMLLPRTDASGGAALLPRTDSRLRPDMRCMENGDMDGSAYEKNRLEEKQREARKARHGDASWNPLWFKLGINPHTGKDDWLFTGEYWKKDWEHCPDIF